MCNKEGEHPISTWCCDTFTNWGALASSHNARLTVAECGMYIITPLVLTKVSQSSPSTKNGWLALQLYQCWPKCNRYVIVNTSPSHLLSFNIKTGSGLGTRLTLTTPRSYTRSDEHAYNYFKILDLHRLE